MPDDLRTRSLPPDQVTTPDPGIAGMAAPPDRAGRYEFRSEIARGGMGVVYAARDTVFDREVAVKVLGAQIGPDSPAFRRFLDEAQITGQLQHPAIPPAHDVGVLADGRPFLVMKLIRGQTLDRWLKGHADSATDRGLAVAAFEQVCQAVAYAHSRGVIHRDLKPANVMVGHFGEVQVMDWGLAKVAAPRQDPEVRGAGDPERKTDPGATLPLSTLRGLLSGTADSERTQAGALLGTPAFMSPEQAIGAVDQIDTRTDVFGLGGILCAILTGKPPFSGEDAESARQMAARAKLEEAFDRLEVCGAERELVALCKRCLSPERADRPADAGEVARAVAALRAAADERARRAELERERDRVRAAEGRKRRKVQRALAGAVALLVLGGGAFAWWLDRQTTERRFAELAREREAEDRLARNAAAVGGLVAECERHLRDENAGKAGLALAEIDRRTLDGGTDDFRDRIERCRTDLAVLRDLDRIDDLRWATKGGHFRGSQGAVEEWPAAFERFGVVVGETRPGDAAVRVKASLVRDRLLEALDLWLVSEPRRRFDLARVLELADPDWFRDSVRGALGAGNAEQVRRLAARDMATRQPPRFAAALGQVQEIPVERRGQILAEAARVRPGELGVLMAAGDIQPIDDPGTAAGRAQWYRAAVAVRPGCVGAWNHLGIALYDLRDYTGAVGAYGEAIGIDPKFAAAHNNLGYALQALGEYGGAVAAFDRALALEPEFALAYNNLAWLLATCPDARHRNAKRAVELAGRAVALRPGDWSYRDTLAAGYAEAGDFDSARKTQLQAIDLLNAEPNADGRDREGLRARLKLYLAKQPYREKAVGGPGLPVAPPPRQK